MTTIQLRMRRAAHKLLGDHSGVAAIEFAMVLPIMAMLFIGTNEFATAIAIDRKVTIMARTLSDLTSQNTSVTDAQFTNIFNAGRTIMTPYSTAAITTSTISEIYIDPNTLQAKIQWTKGTGTPQVGTTVAIPTALKVAGTYLILSEVKYSYVPSVAWFLNKETGITLSDVSYTRPRQSLCVIYNTDECPKN